DADDATVGPDRLQGHLKPAARPRPQVDDDVATPEKAEPGVQLRQLVRAAGTVAGGAGAAVVGVLPPVGHAAPAGRRGATRSRAGRARGRRRGSRGARARRRARGAGSRPGSAAGAWRSTRELSRAVGARSTA